MAYKFNTTLERSELMKKIKSTNTISEDMLSKALWHEGIRYRRNYKKLPGTPDIAITKYKIVVFIDGEFWHGYDWNTKKNKIKSNKDYWVKKIERNISRDKENNSQLNKLGWIVIRFWDKQVKKNLNECIFQIKKLIQNES